MLSFVVQNFYFNTPLWIKNTRYNNFTYNFLTPLISNFLFFYSFTKNSLSLFNLNIFYFHWYSQLFILNLWKFFKKILNLNFSLFTNNISKSVVHINLVNYLEFFNSNNFLFLEKYKNLFYFKPFKILHFCSLKSFFKKIIFFFYYILVFNYISTQADFNTYYNFLLISNLLYLYPLYNSFYFRIYHY